MRGLPKSDFVDHLIDANNLRAFDFDRFIFFHGMMFGSTEKWWGAGGSRSSAHEGLDLCFFASPRNAYFRLDETSAVPMLYDGRVEHITDDFLGRTVITRHDFHDSGLPALLSLYGHLNPDKNLRVGDEIDAGEVFARIAGIENRKIILLPHLHLSLAKPHRLPPAHLLEWEFLNSVDRSVFIDPLDAICPGHSVMAYNDRMDLSEMFARCGPGNDDAS